MKLTSDERVYLRNTILTVVNGYYEAFRRDSSGSSEPCISVGVLFDEFNENRGWGPLSAPKEFADCKAYTPARRSADLRRAVWATAEQLRKQGLLSSSLGLGLNGREARCYEPA